MQPWDVTTNHEEVVLIDPTPEPGGDLHEDPTNSAAGITLGLLLILLAVIVGVLDLGGERRGN